MPTLQRVGRVAWLLLALLWAWPLAAQPTEAPPMPKKLRIALVPLDDRPVCLQYPQMMAPLAYAEVVAPPIGTLGRFTTPGDTVAVARWLRAQDWSRVDALIVSIDMLAYGGLVASRVHGVDEPTALARLAVLDEIARAHPDLPVYAFSTLMRLAPTADGLNEAYREKLARWAEVSADPRSPAERDEVAALESAVPAAALADYRRARARNRAVNLASVQRTASGVIDYLVVSQDDAKPRGVHLADRAAVTTAASGRNLVGRVGIQPGADEVAMLLLARAVLEARHLTPTMRATFSSEAARTMVAPFEDRQLHETVDFQLVAAGARRSRLGDPADLHLFVFASRHDAGAPRQFASDIVKAVAAGDRVIVADVDPKGDVQGASPAFTEALLEARVFPKLYGYASWNTAGNTIGTAIPHGLLAWAGATLATRCTSPAFTALGDAQVTFMLHRLVNDYAYQGVLRPEVNADLRKAGRTSLWLKDHAPEVAARLREALAPKLAEYARAFMPGYMPPAPRVTDLGVSVGAPRDLEVRLPWDRTFEAAITFDVPVSALMGPARRLPACVPTP
ncbi:hypothetical protein TBR22_A46320 [Luteitalea sp. TBR-22]|uniref:DUF4127 family protein n=1 Tax=Luteitalea sp. TBR-22 TaxID=2802971 RepID=UPI001AF48791|nr:DUF4127 family protein [Luteitalea sp. TBR-22]BCS35405.1 hypothetical protein TBR22_A46320 [Luteitalea sp. TBR-22]